MSDGEFMELILCITGCFLFVLMVLLIIWDEFKKRFIKRKKVLKVNKTPPPKIW